MGDSHTVIVAVVVESLVCRRERNGRLCCNVVRATALRLSEWGDIRIR